MNYTAKIDFRGIEMKKNEKKNKFLAIFLIPAKILTESEKSHE